MSDDREAVLIAEFPKTATEVLRITREKHHGREVVQIRTWFRNREGVLCPGREGVHFRHALAPDIARAMLRSGGDV